MRTSSATTTDFVPGPMDANSGICPPASPSAAGPGDLRRIGRRRELSLGTRVQGHRETSPQRPAGRRPRASGTGESVREGKARSVCRARSVIAALASAIALSLCLGVGTASAASNGRGSTPSGTTAPLPPRSATPWGSRCNRPNRSSTSTTASARETSTNSIASGRANTPPVGGNFPLSVENGGGDPDLDVDDTSGGTKGNIYYTPDTLARRPLRLQPRRATRCPNSRRKAARSAASRSTATATCGPATTASQDRRVRRRWWRPDQSAERRLRPLQRRDRHRDEPHLRGAVRRQRLPVRPRRQRIRQPDPCPGIDRQLEDRGRLGRAPPLRSTRIPAAARNLVRVYDTTTLTEVENFDIGVDFIRGIAIDEASHTLFLTSGTSGEFSAARRCRNGARSTCRW